MVSWVFLPSRWDNLFRDSFMDMSDYCRGLRQTIDAMTESPKDFLDGLETAYSSKCTDAASVQSQDLSAAMLKAPNFFVKGWNFGKHMAWAAWNGFPQASKETIKQRLSICEACEHREDEHCKLCGCKCELKNHLMNKLAHAGTTCPIGKW